MLGRCAYIKSCRQWCEVIYMGHNICEKHLSLPTEKLHKRFLKKPLEGCLCKFCDPNAELNQEASRPEESPAASPSLAFKRAQASSPPHGGRRRKAVRSRS